MDLVTIILLAIGLSFDSFAVSVSSGVVRTSIRFFTATRIAFSLAFFQALLPLLGWIIGLRLQHLVETFDHWVAMVLLSLLGIRMIWESLSSGEKKVNFDPLHLPTLLMMSLATSVDAFVVGISFGFLQFNIWLALFIIGFVTFLFSMLGILFGKNLGSQLGRKAEFAGGLILIGIGLRILISHLYFQ